MASRAATCRYFTAPTLDVRADGQSFLISRGQSALVAVAFFDGFYATQPQVRLAPRFLWRQAEPYIILRLQLKMGFDLFSQFAFPAGAQEGTQQTRPCATQPYHYASPGSLKKRAMISVVCCHSFASAASCLRPLFVIR